MRIHTVEMTAFGPFKDTQRVDFDAFADDGLFLIAGKTGAGKTSILDAVCFALYGSVPRYETSAEARYRSDHADPDAVPSVAVELTVGETRYRVTRSPQFERPKKRGQGSTTVAAQAGLARLHDGDWVGVAGGSAVVATHLAEIVQLTKDQFLQVMLLAQNRFQEFLVAESKDRRALLQALFRTRRFEDYENDLLERRRVLREAVAASTTTVEQNVTQLVDRTDATPPEASTEDPDTLRSWLHDLLDAEADRVAAALDRADVAHATAAAARRALEETRAVRDRQARRDAASARLADAESRADVVAEHDQVVRAAARAAACWPAVTAARDARDAVDAAETERKAAAAAYGAVAEGPDVGVAAPPWDAPLVVLDEHDAALTRLVGSLAKPAQDEAGLPRLRDAAEAAAKRLTLHHEERDAAAAQQARIAAHLEDLTAALDVHRPVAADLEPAQEKVTETERALDAARRAVEAGSVHQKAVGLVVTLRTELAAASADVRSLWQRRLDGFAGTLAADLVPGNPCPVCGGREHPAPATSAGDAVTDVAIEAAQRVEEAAGAAVKQAEADVTAAYGALLTLQGQAGGRDTDELDAVLAAARQRLATARAATEEVAATTARQGELALDRDRTQADLDRLAAELPGLVADESRTRAALDTVEREVAEARGAFVSVAARTDAIRARIRATRSLVDARQTEATAAGTLARATATLTDALAEHGFATTDEVAAARRTPGEVERLERLVAEHRDVVAGAQAVLAEADLQDLPPEPVDLRAVEATATGAESDLADATRAHGAAAQRRQVAHKHAAEISVALDRAGALGAELAVVGRLAATVHGEAPNDRKMRLVDFVLAAELEQIVDAANVRLAAMSAGRYRLVHSDAAGRGQSGLGLQVLDQHTGTPRSTQSLSGGEKFLASLALALGLAETVTHRAGGITLDTLFIDEGFGSLDTETLEVAMATLDSLRAGGRTVGVISHVEAMQEQIPARLTVTTVDGGWSEVRQ